MRLPIYQIDAFTDALFSGNPAAVCPLEYWLDDGKLQSIAAENNLSETAFIVEREGLYELRWFTPALEVDLCGHATLAAAHVVFNFINPGVSSVGFETKSGLLEVVSEGDLLAMSFPARPGVPCQCPEILVRALGHQPSEVLLSRDYLLVYDSEEIVRSVQPQMDMLMNVEGLGIIITSPGKGADFVSRFFAPKVGVPEDPVTGSAHCTLVPYWASRLSKRRLHAFQLSRRGGELFCEYGGDRVKIAGRAVTYLEGHISV